MYVPIKPTSCNIWSLATELTSVSATLAWCKRGGLALLTETNDCVCGSSCCIVKRAGYPVHGDSALERDAKRLHHYVIAAFSVTARFQ